MQKLWKIFNKRKDIEFSFVVSICTGLLLLMFAIATGTQMFNDFLMLSLLAAWLVFSLYFVVALYGYHKSK